MPFDAATYTDPTALYMERRQRAWDEVWSKVPAEQFDILDWQCGTTACAIGWLAENNHDGWFWRPETSEVWQHPAHTTIASVTDTDDVAAYFGITDCQAARVFCIGYGKFEHAYLKRLSSVTLVDVHRVLMSMPVTVPAEA